MANGSDRRFNRREINATLAGALTAGLLGARPVGGQSGSETSERAGRHTASEAKGNPCYRIYPLRNGDLAVNGKHAFVGGDEGRTCPYRLYSFLILGGEKPMLVDAGLVDVAEMNRGAAKVLQVPITQKPEHTILNQLRKFGLTPADIGHIFVTHLHFDHVDGLDAFTNAKVYIGRKEWGIAVQRMAEGRSWGHGRIMNSFLNDPQWSKRLVLVEDQQILPGVESIWVGGHTPGSMAYGVKTAHGRVVMTGDTVSLLENIERDVAVGVHDDPDQCMAGMKKIRERADFIMPSHDPDNLKRWPPRPEGMPRYTIHAIKVGECEVRDQITFHGSSSQATRTFFLYVWAILGGEKPILVETGPNPKYVEEFNRGTAQYIPGGVKQTPEELTPVALKRHGIDPADVSHVIITHAHADHYDYFDAFPNARFVINELELEQNLHRLNPDVLKAITSRRGVLHVVEDEEVVPGIRAVPLGCHTPGSQGVLVQTWIGPAILTGDVVYLYENIEKDIPTNSPDERACREAMAKIRGLADIVLPAHDPLTLKRWPGGLIGEAPEPSGAG